MRASITFSRRVTSCEKKEAVRQAETLDPRLRNWSRRTDRGVSSVQVVMWPFASIHIIATGIDSCVVAAAVVPVARPSMYVCVGHGCFVHGSMAPWLHTP